MLVIRPLEVECLGDEFQLFLYALLYLVPCDWNLKYTVLSNG